MKYTDLINDKEIKKIFFKIDDNTDNQVIHGEQHALNVVDYTQKISRLLKIDDETQEYLKIAAYLHDIGHQYGKDNHPINSKIFANKYLKDKIDEKWLKRILSAIEKHHEHKKINELDLFEHILLFADKMDFSYKRLNKKYLEIHQSEYLLEKDIININFDIKNNTFIILIKTKNLSLNKFQKWSFYNKTIKRIEEFANKINMNYEIKII